jgi:hypothetical protein
LTEEEAKTKWCPFVRLEGNESPHGRDWMTNRGEYAQPTSPRDALSTCIGSACMAWRWKKRFGPDPDKPENITELPPTEGYCGLAGRPE